MKSIQVIAEATAGIQEVPVPTIPDGWLLVKTKALGVNPTDFKHIDWNLGGIGARCGCDYAGIVEELGTGTTGFQKGDRIAGFCHGGDRLNQENGAFAEYILVKPGPQMKIPDNVTDEEAATLGVSVCTVGQGLYKQFGLPLPNKPAEKPFPVLIYGGSTATGIYAIQFAKASGLTVVTTASPKNFDYLRSVGADAVFDYKSPTCAGDIQKFTDGKLEFSWDCTGFGEDICVQAMGGPGKGKLASIEPLSNYPWTLAYDVLGETYIGLGGKLREADPEELEFATMFMEIARGMLSRGELKVIRRTMNKGGMGLEGVLFGINEVRNNRVSAEKLVYTMSH